MPLVANSLGGRDTHASTHTHAYKVDTHTRAPMHTHTHTHTHKHIPTSWTKATLENQVCTTIWLAHAWFKKE